LTHFDYHALPAVPYNKSQKTYDQNKGEFMSTSVNATGALKSAERDGMQIDWDVPITMDDGIVLRADIYRPIGAGKYPVIASHGPYAKGLTFAEGYPRQWEALIKRFPEALQGSSGKYAAWETVDPEQWTADGYAVVRVDSRGAGRSPGFVDVWSQREAKDFYDCIEWIAAQPWSNGKVGLTGISYYAKNEWQVAALHPPHLVAICPWEGANDYYREMTHHGGIHNAFLPDWYRRMSTIQHGLGSRGFRNPESGLLACGDVDMTDEELAANRSDLDREILDHPFDDKWHADHSSIPEEINIPVLSAANWGGLGNHQRGNFTAWSQVSSDPKWLEVHGGTHWAGFYTAYGRNLQKRFFDHFLLGKGDWLKQPPVSLNIRKVDGTFSLRSEEEWPLARTKWQRKYLNLTGLSLTENVPKERGEQTFQALGEGITFSTTPFESEVEITGPLSAKLWISSSTDDADIFVVLRAFDPEANEVLFEGANDPKTPLSQGWLRGSHRMLDKKLSQPWMPWHLHQRAEPLIPGEIYELDVEIWPTCIVLPAGYRLALSVLGRDFDHGLEPVKLGGRIMQGSGPFLHDHPEDRPAKTFDNQITLYTGDGLQSSIMVPVIPR
jgi:predicted acyl esterase